MKEKFFRVNPGLFCVWRVIVQNGYGGKFPFVLKNGGLLLRLC
jgi:hypothetical protein